MGAVVTQVVGHRPGDCEVLGSILKLGLITIVISLSKKLYPIAPATHLLSQEHIVCNISGHS